MEKSCKENELVEIEMTELIEEVKEWKARGYVKYPRGHTECRSTREILHSVVAGSQGYLLKKHGVTYKMQRKMGRRNNRNELAVSIGSISLTRFNRPIPSGKISLRSSTAISASNMLGRTT
jgi:hypothetical protein